MSGEDAAAYLAKHKVQLRPNFKCVFEKIV